MKYLSLCGKAGLQLIRNLHTTDFKSIKIAEHGRGYRRRREQAKSGQAHRNVGDPGPVEKIDASPFGRCNAPCPLLLRPPGDHLALLAALGLGGDRRQRQGQRQRVALPCMSGLSITTITKSPPPPPAVPLDMTAVSSGRSPNLQLFSGSLSRKCPSGHLNTSAGHTTIAAPPPTLEGLPPNNGGGDEKITTSTIIATAAVDFAVALFPLWRHRRRRPTRHHHHHAGILLSMYHTSSCTKARCSFVNAQNTNNLGRSPKSLLIHVIQGVYLNDIPSK